MDDEKGSKILRSCWKSVSEYTKDPDAVLKKVKEDT